MLAEVKTDEYAIACSLVFSFASTLACVFDFIILDRNHLDWGVYIFPRNHINYALAVFLPQACDEYAQVVKIPKLDEGDFVLTNLTSLLNDAVYLRIFINKWKK